MRSAIAMALCLGFVTNVSWAGHGHNGGGGGSGGGTPKVARLTVVNHTDEAVTVVVNSGLPFTLEPEEARGVSITVIKGNDTFVKVEAYLAATPAISASGTATILAEKAAIASISSPTSSTLAVSFSGAIKSAHLARESGVALATTGGLLPLLWLAHLMARVPRRRSSLENGRKGRDDSRA